MYPVEHYIQPLLELAEKFRSEIGDDTARITRIEASLPDQIQRSLFAPRDIKAAPPNAHAASMSAPYSVAMALSKPGAAPLTVEDGNPRRPMQSADVAAKFHRNCRHWSEASRQSVIAAVAGLPRNSARQLMQAIGSVRPA